MPSDSLPATLRHPRAAVFWLSLLLTGIATGIGAAALTMLLDAVQHLVWPGPNLLQAARGTVAWRHVAVLAGAGLLTGGAQLLLTRLASGNAIDITEAIWFTAGRLPALRTLGSAVLSVVIVAMGASLGREGAPKQAGAVAADQVANRFRLSDEQRRLLVACGAGAGMGAAYGVPLGGALFAIEVLRGALSLRLVVPALFVSLLATGVSWFVLPDAPTYLVPAYATTAPLLIWSLFAGPVIGLVSVGFVRAVAFADHCKPKGGWRFVLPAIALGALGIVSIRFPQLLGNGKDLSQLVFTGQVAPLLLLALLLLKPLFTLVCLESGAPGGLFTPSLTVGALLGAVLGFACPGVPAGACALVGAAALIAATTQGPVSAMVLIMELTGRDRPLILPTLIAVAAATLISRTIEPRSIYDARLSGEELRQRLAMREGQQGHS